MSLTLILMRHAKSSWSDATLDDFDRPLNARGRASAEAVGAWLAARGHVPQQVMVSGARRTVDTWGRMAPMMQPAVTMRSEPALYHASADTILAVLRRADAQKVLLIGHNPGLSDFACRIARASDDPQRFDDLPTAATLLIRFKAEAWSSIGWAEGEVRDFIVPRDLL